MPSPLWSIVRIEGQGDAPVSLVCDEGQVPVKVTLYDSVNNVYDTIILCQVLDDPDPCTLLNALAESHEPNDWGAECP